MIWRSAASLRAERTSVRSMMGEGAVSTIWMRMRRSSCRSSDDRAIARVGLPMVSMPISRSGAAASDWAALVSEVGKGFMCRREGSSCVGSILSLTTLPLVFPWSTRLQLAHLLTIPEAKSRHRRQRVEHHVLDAASPLRYERLVKFVAHRVQCRKDNAHRPNPREQGPAERLAVRTPRVV